MRDQALIDYLGNNPLLPLHVRERLVLFWA